MTRSFSSKINAHRAAGRPDRLLRSAVTAFCSIARPTKRETAQLDDLAMPLLGAVSTETLRFIAAALSESPYAPPNLVRRLCDEPLDVAAPLLIRSPLLTSIDLVALIGRHGPDHARAIAARGQLDPRIARLITTIHDLGVEETSHRLAETARADAVETGEASTADAAPMSGADAARERLRSMMRPAAQDVLSSLHWPEAPGVFRKLRSTALAGVPALFHTALADVLQLDMRQASDMTEATDPSRLIVALRALSLSEEQAFFITQCVWPARFGQLRTIAAFVEAFHAVGVQDAQRVVADWRSRSSTRQHDGLAATQAPAAANQHARLPGLKAS